MKKIFTLLMIILCLGLLTVPAMADNTVTVHVKAPDDWYDVGCWPWNNITMENAYEFWPGEQMERQSDGWYTLEIPNWCDSVVINDWLYYGYQTYDLPIEPGYDVWIVIDDDSLAYYSATVYYSDPGESTPDSDTFTVYVDPFDDWEDVYLYAVDSDGDKLADWPGFSMTDNDWDGWYEIELPKGSMDFCISNGAIQSYYFTLYADRDIWLRADDLIDGNVMVSSYTSYPGAASTATTPVTSVNLDDLDSLAIVGSGLPGISEWDPADPNGDMDCLEYGVYYKELAFTAGSSVKFKFAGNDMWDDNYNFGSGDILLSETVEMLNGSGSIDMSITVYRDCILTFLVDLTPLTWGGNATLTVNQIITEDPIVPPDPPVLEETITVYADPFDDWSNIALYAWKDDLSELYVWPGIPMTDEDGDGWYELEIPAGYTNFIVSNSSNKQTVDLEIDGSRDFWITLDGMNDDGKAEAVIDFIYPGDALTNNEPMPELDSLAMVGEGVDGIDWETLSYNNMTKNGSIYTRELYAPAGSELTFMFLGNTSWFSDYQFSCNGRVTAGEYLNLSTDHFDYMYLSVDVDCLLTFFVDLTDMNNPTLFIQQTPVIIEDPEPITVYADPFDNWTGITLYAWMDDMSSLAEWPGVPMTDEDGDGWYELEIPGGYSNIIIAADSGSKQTVDLMISGEEDCWIILDGMEGSYATAMILRSSPGAASTEYEPGFEPEITVPTEPSAPSEPSDKPEDPTTDSSGETEETKITYPKMTRPDKDEDEEEDEKKDSPLTMILVIGISAVALLGTIGGVLLIIFGKKKPKQQ